MRRALSLLLLLATLVAPVGAPAEGKPFVIVLDPGPSAVMLMDENGNSLSTMVNSMPSNGKVYWTLSVTNNGASQALLYTRDDAGNWLYTGVTYDMVVIFPTNGPAVTDQPTNQPPWPVYDQMQQYGVAIKPLEGEKRVQSRCGPGKDYHGAGGYKTYKVTSTAALFAEGSYMLVDLQYTTVGHRRVYFLTSAFTGTGDVPDVSLSGYAAYTKAAQTPVFGPGGDYDVFTEAAIPSGTALSVYFEEDGWVFAEFTCELGAVRAWIPAAQVSW